MGVFLSTFYHLQSLKNKDSNRVEHVKNVGGIK